MINYRTIFVPDVGDADEITIADILVNKGAQVEADEHVITLETDKAFFEIPTPVTGYVADINVDTGESVSVGDKLIGISSEWSTHHESRMEHSKGDSDTMSSNDPGVATNRRLNGKDNVIRINKYQRLALFITLIIAVAALLFPPFEHAVPNGRFAGFYPLFAVPDDMYIKVDIGLLVVGEAVIFLTGVMLFVVLNGWRDNEGKSEKNIRATIRVRRLMNSIVSRTRRLLNFVVKWWWVPFVVALILRLIKMQ